MWIKVFLLYMSTFMYTSKTRETTSLGATGTEGRYHRHTHTHTERDRDTDRHGQT